MAIPKLERLMNLTAALLDTRIPLSVEQIRLRIDGYGEAGPAFRRQFERDKDDLREMGVPVQVLPVPGSDPQIDGYRILPEEYYLPDPGLDAAEAAAIRLAARAVRIEGMDGPTSLWKLGLAPAGTGHSDQEASQVILPSDKNLENLFKASTERCWVTFAYRGSQRRLEPHSLSFQRGNWYVSGLVVDLDEVRIFRLDRIEGKVTVGDAIDSVDVRANVEPGRFDPWRIGHSEPVRARVRVDALIAPSVVHEVGADRVVRQLDSGDVEIELDVTNADGFRSWVLGFLDRAEVLSPPELRQEIVSWLRDLTVRTS